MFRPKLRSLLIVLAAVALAGLAACGGTAATPTTTPTDPAAPPSGKGGGKVAPELSFPLYEPNDAISGDRFTLADHRGSPVVLNFWAPLCPPCRAEMPDFQEVWQEYRDRGVLIVGVDVGPYTLLGNEEQAREFLKEIDVTYPVGQAEDRSAVEDYKVLAMPTTVFIAADGSIQRTWGGPLNKDKLVSLTEELLQ